MEAAAPAVGPEPRPERARLVYPGLAVPFILLILCFAAWGAAANLTDVLVGVFRASLLAGNPARHVRVRSVARSVHR